MTPPVEDPRELTTAMVALQCRSAPVPLDAAAKFTEASIATPRTSHANRRALLALGLFVLLLAGILQLATSTPDTRPSADDGSRADVVFSNALSGTCLTWPADSPDKPSFVQCTDDHMFEVARPVGMKNFMEPCQLAVRDYLGPRFDPNGKFTSAVLWAGDAEASKTDERNMLCGIQLPGPDGRPIPFKGMVAEQDQSKVWPAGTCLGIDAATGHSTEKVVQCSESHAVEVTGTVNLADQFPNARPTEADQDGFLRAACTRTTDEYLAPVPLNATGLSVNYSLMSSASWAAGSRQVSCVIGTKRGDDGWVSLVGGAKDGVATEGQAPPPPAEAPVSTPSEVVAPLPEEEQPTVQGTSTPATTTAPATTASPSASSATSTTATSSPVTPSSSTPSTTATTPAVLGPAPGPASPPPELEDTEPAANVVTIAGIPITLPWPAAPPAG